MNQFTRIILFLSVFSLASQPVSYAFDTTSVVQGASHAVETVKTYIAKHGVALIIAGVVTFIIGSALLKPKKVRKKILVAANKDSAKNLIKKMCEAAHSSTELDCLEPERTLILQLRKARKDYIAVLGDYETEKNLKEKLARKYADRYIDAYNAVVMHGNMLSEEIQ